MSLLTSPELAFMWMWDRWQVFILL
jgi:hypothetical protein